MRTHLCLKHTTLLAAAAGRSGRGNCSCARESGSHLHLMTVRCPRKSLVSCIVPLIAAFMNSSRACLHSIAQASQPFAMVEPIYVKSGWLSRRPANSQSWWLQVAELAISCTNNLATCRTRKSQYPFQGKSRSVWRRSILAVPWTQSRTLAQSVKVIAPSLKRHD